MARKYYGSFYSITGALHKVEIWDAPSGSGAGGTELLLANNGYEINRDGSGSKFFENPTRSSRSTSHWVIPNNTVLADFKNLATNNEQYWAVLIYQDSVLQHVGRVVADQMTFQREAIEAKPVISLGAVDGVELLDGFKVSADWFTDGKIQISQLFRKSLDLLGLKDYWVVNGTQTDYLRDAVSPYSSDATRKGIDLLKVDINTFVTGYDAFKDLTASDVNAFQYASENMVSCKEAIKQICDILQCQFIHELGVYWLVSAAEYLDSTVSYRQYSYTLQYIGTGTYTHAVTLGATSLRPQWEAKPSMSYQPAAKYVQIDTERTLNTGVYRSYNNKTTTTLSGVFTGIPTGATPDEAPMRVRFALKFQRHIFSGSPSGAEDLTRVSIQIWLTDSAGNKMALDRRNYFWYSFTGAVIPIFNEDIKTDQSTTWTSFVFDKQVSTAPAGFDTLNVLVYGVKAWKNRFNIFGIPKNPPDVFSKDYWGAIQIAFADASPYNNPDFTFNITEVFNPGTNSALNSTPIILNPKYYYSNSKYGTGNILANNGTADVVADDWYGGWDSVTHGSPTAMLGQGVAGLYRDFVPVIQGTWVDAGTLTAIKSLSFDSFKWIFNGGVYSAMSEQWSAEWLGLVPIYTGLTSTGEGLRLGNGLKDRVNYQDIQIGKLNDEVQRTPDLVLSHLVNDADGAPSAVPTVNTQYEVMVQYDLANEQMEWHLQEHGTFKTYTTGTSSLDTNFEGHLGNTAGGSVILTLPAVATQKGKKYYFVKSGSSHTFRINAATGENINGTDHFLLNTNYDSHTIICDGTQWFIIAAHP
jgi:hypothetical protein